jgi:hypothetical protein
MQAFHLSREPAISWYSKCGTACSWYSVYRDYVTRLGGMWFVPKIIEILPGSFPQNSCSLLFRAFCYSELLQGWPKPLQASRRGLSDGCHALAGSPVACLLPRWDVNVIGLSVHLAVQTSPQPHTSRRPPAPPIMNLHSRSAAGPPSREPPPDTVQDYEVPALNLGGVTSSPSCSFVTWRL